MPWEVQGVTYQNVLLSEPVTNIPIGATEKDLSSRTQWRENFWTLLRKTMKIREGPQVIEANPQRQSKASK